MQRLEWILFDLDNTLLDFNQAETYALQNTLERNGIAFNTSTHEAYRKVNHACWRAFEDGKLSKEKLRTQRFDLFFEAIDWRGGNSTRFSEQYLDHLSETSFPLDGGIPLLQELQQNYQLAIVTNGLKEVQRPRLRNTGITDYFKAIIVSDEIGSAKPQKDFFDYTFNEIGHPKKEEVVIIGDSINSDIRGGKNYGIKTCWFNPKQKQNETEITPDYEIQHLFDIKKLLLK